MTDDMTTLITRIAAYRNEPVPAPQTNKLLERLIPLEEGLKKLLYTSYPDHVLEEGISLYELQVQLKGRKGGKPHIGELAAACRKNGLVRVRGWTEGRAGFRAVWKKTPTE